MSSNPYWDDTIKTNAPDAHAPIEELQPKPLQVSYPAQPPRTDAPQDYDAAQSTPERQKRGDSVRFAIGKLNDYLLWALMVLETMLALRFLLKLIGADPNNLFAGFLYALTDILLLPFLNIVPSPSIHRPYQSFEFSTLIGMLIYFLIVFALRRFFRLLVSEPESDEE
jgi:uncharacterized protein YggT (Ycf19 family)